QSSPVRTVTYTRYSSSVFIFYFSFVVVAAFAAGTRLYAESPALAFGPISWSQRPAAPSGSGGPHETHSVYVRRIDLSCFQCSRSRRRPAAHRSLPCRAVQQQRGHGHLWKLCTHHVLDTRQGRRWLRQGQAGARRRSRSAAPAR